MAKYEGTQTIPAEYSDQYGAELNQPQDDKVVKKRFPFRQPFYQKYGAKVSPGQIEQRSFFTEAVSKFNDLPESERSAWYADAPEWNSILWYYNWYMLHAIPNLWAAMPGGDAILKLIQSIRQSIPTGGGQVTFPTAVNPLKSIIMLWGGAHTRTELDIGDANQMGYAWGVQPVFDSFNSSSVFVEWSETPIAAGICTLIVVEYL